MPEKDLTKRVTRIIKDVDKIVQTAEKVMQEVKKLKGSDEGNKDDVEDR